VIGRTFAVIAGAATLGFAGWLVRDSLSGPQPVSWLLGRASGIASYVLLVALVTTGLVLSHPWARGIRRPSAATRLALHVSLATFTLVFVVLHIVVLATDPWAHVGWKGALLPLASAYRPVPVTLGVIALWAGLVTGLTARLAGSIAARVWWPVHKVSIVMLVLVWGHSVLAGTDVVALRGFYLASGFAVVGLAVSRYASRTTADKVDELTRSIDDKVEQDDFADLFNFDQRARR
jgi:predicted ferric reductase